MTVTSARRLMQTFARAGLASCALLFGIASAAEVPTRAVADWLDRTVPLEMQRSAMPGFSIAVVADGRIIYAQGFGTRDRARALPATPDTLFAIGSITKSFVAIATMQLAEQGKLKLDDPVSRYVPLSLGRADDPIRVRHLLTHSLGVPSLGTSTVVLNREIGFDTGVPFGSVADFYRFVNGAQDEIVTAPGERFFYHNGGWRILGHVVQRVSGIPFHRYLENAVIRPMGMTRTTLSRARFEADADHAVFYRRGADGGLIAAPFPLPNVEDNPEFGFVTAAGGIASSARDMARYVGVQLSAGALEKGRVASRESFEAMQSPHISVEPDRYGPAAYGYGLHITPDFLGHRLISHSGSVLVSTAYLAFVPDLKAGVAMMGNSSGMRFARIAESVLAILAGQDPEMLPERRVERRIAALTGDYATYRLLERVKVVASGGMLYLESPPEIGEAAPSREPLIPEDPTLASPVFYTLSNGLKSRVTFETRVDGRIDLCAGSACFHKLH
ncbi:MAG: serine hydrolase [Gammaproteobacteria bacterium]